MDGMLFESFLDILTASEDPDSLIASFTTNADQTLIDAVPRMITLEALQAAYRRAAEDFAEYDAADTHVMSRTFASVCLEEAVKNRNNTFTYLVVE